MVSHSLARPAGKEVMLMMLRDFDMF
jgi:hypothetical protein